MAKTLFRCINELHRSRLNYLGDYPVIGHLYNVVVVQEDGIPNQYNVYHLSDVRIGILINNDEFQRCFKNVSEYREEQINKLIYDIS